MPRISPSAVSPLVKMRGRRPRWVWGLDAALLEDKKSLIANGVQFIPSGTNQFQKPDLAVFYCELYEPLLVNPDPKQPTMVAIKIRVLDRKTGEQKQDSGFMRVDLPPSTGNPDHRAGSKIAVSGARSRFLSTGVHG